MPLDPAQQAAKLQFDRQSASYGKSHILSQTEDIASALPHLQCQPGQKALDIATGGGHTALFFAKQGLGVTAADIAPGMLAQARALLQEEGLPLDTREHPAEALPYEDASFDLVTCRVAAHHFSSPASFIREAARVLKPGGSLLLIDGSLEDGRPETEEWLHQVEKYRDPSHGRFLTPQKWGHLCGQAALRVIHSELLPKKQPDLEWYFNTAKTSPENRRKVLELIRQAPAEVFRTLRLNPDENGKITWWWQILVLVARKIP
jgi:ubiquinone/menaquinone biosynthesis C-methylase UbiE